MVCSCRRSAASECLTGSQKLVPCRPLNVTPYIERHEKYLTLTLWTRWIGRDTLAWSACPKNPPYWLRPTETKTFHVVASNRGRRDRRPALGSRKHTTHAHTHHTKAYEAGNQRHKAGDVSTATAAKGYQSPALMNPTSRLTFSGQVKTAAGPVASMAGVGGGRRDGDRTLRGRGGRGRG